MARLFRIAPINRLGLRKMATTVKKVNTQQPEWTKPLPTKEAPVLKIYNSLTRTKNEFITLKPKSITWYSCGPTVYDHSHMGHARNYVSTDICRRILQDYFGYNIKFIQNVTDIDDKIIIAARQQYLFEQKFGIQYKSVSDELVKLSREYLALYIKTNIPQFSGNDVEKDFGAWAESINVQELAATNPKLPMYVKASKRAHSTVFAIEAKSMPIDQFLDNIRDVVVIALDKEYGSTVSDPSIFRKLPLYWENSFNEDMRKLNVLKPSVTTRVSEYIPEIIDFVDRIIENGFAYKTSDGSVYFDTVKFENDPKHDYAKLQPWNKGDTSLIDDGEGSLSTGQGAKKNAADFALWKASKPGEPSWASKWGEGRPGWHIECSVMATDIAGKTMDIHSGGIDLCFPHHDNEIAQSEAHYDSKQWVNYFMHNGHLHIQGQKMSKSLKNFITIDEALKEFSSRQLRLVFASTQWEKPLDFKDSLIKEVKSLESTVSKFFTTVRALNNENRRTVENGDLILKKLSNVEKQLYDDLENAQIELHEAFCDNLSSPKALKVIQDLISKSNQYIQSCVTKEVELRIEVLVEITRWISKNLNILGFEIRQDRLGWLEEQTGVSDPATGTSSSTEDIALPYVTTLSLFRDKIRALAIKKANLGDFLTATDSVRSELINLGVSLDDLPSGEALVKFLDPIEQKTLIEQQQAKDKALLEKKEKQQRLHLQNEAKQRERLEKMKIKPSDLFKDSALYSEWDHQGLPTKDANGEEITKSMRKKLLKQYQQQEKLHNEYLNQE